MKKILILVIILSALVFAGCSNQVTGNAVAGDEFVKIPLSEIGEEAIFKSYDTGSKTVKYFLVKDNSGEIRTAFDACDVCGGSKGYHQEGDYMVCNNCGQKFKISELGSGNVGGGCWPSYLSHEIEGDYVVISGKELASSAWRF